MKCDIAFDTTLEQQKPLKLLKTNRLKTRPTINSLGGRFQRNTHRRVKHFIKMEKTHDVMPPRSLNAIVDVIQVVIRPYNTVRKTIPNF